MSTNILDFQRKRERKERRRKQEEDRRQRTLAELDSQDTKKDNDDDNDDYVASVLAKARHAAAQVTSASSSSSVILSRTSTKTTTDRRPTSTTASTTSDDHHHPRNHHPPPPNNNYNNNINDDSPPTKKRKKTPDTSNSSSFSSPVVVGPQNNSPLLLGSSPVALLKQQERQKRAMAVSSTPTNNTNNKWLVPASKKSSTTSFIPSPAVKRDLGKWLDASSSNNNHKEPDKKNKSHHYHHHHRKQALDTSFSNNCSPPSFHPLLESQSPEDDECKKVTTTKNTLRQYQPIDEAVVVEVTASSKKKESSSNGKILNNSITTKPPPFANTSIKPKTPPPPTIGNVPRHETQDKDDDSSSSDSDDSSDSEDLLARFRAAQQRALVGSSQEPQPQNQNNNNKSTVNKFPSSISRNNDDSDHEDSDGSTSKDDETKRKCQRLDKTSIRRENDISSSSPSRSRNRKLDNKSLMDDDDNNNDSTIEEEEEEFEEEHHVDDYNERNNHRKNLTTHSIMTNTHRKGILNKRRRLMNDDDDDDDDDDSPNDKDNLPHRRRTKQTLDDRRSDDDEIEDLPPKLSEDATRTFNNNSTNVDDHLWWDSSEHEEEESDTETKKKKKAKQSKSRPKTTKRRRNDTHQNGNPTGSSRRHEYESDDDDDQEENDAHCDEESLRQALHPFFPNPIFETDSLEPLVLCKEVDDDDDNRDSTTSNDEGKDQVPASINRYLKPYQRQGIEFMYKCLAKNRGVVLGDDMGLGKTIQVLSLLSALFQKTGTGLDKMEVDRRIRIVKDKIRNFRTQQDAALAEGRVISSTDYLFSVEAKVELNLSSRWYPVLIVVPNATMDNWQREFTTWTHFGLTVYHKTGEGDKALDRIRNGTAEVMLTPSSYFQGKDTFRQLNKIPWRLVVIDEFHVFKNAKGLLSQHLRQLKAEQGSLVLGMTGTLMQNEHKELWNLIDLVETDYLGSWNEFRQDFGDPILMGRTKTADQAMRLRAEAKTRALTLRLRPIFLQRKKEDVLAGDLPEKNEYVVLCDPSPLQKRIYEHLLTLPDFENIEKAASPCNCSINQNFFKRYTRLGSPAERLQFYRANKKDIIPRRKCCYDKPYNPRRHEPGQPFIDPDAVLWRFHDKHADDEGCGSCPYCMLFPALLKLYKLSSHVALLQVDHSLASAPPGSPKHIKYVKDTQFARVAFPEDVISKLAGGSIIRNDNIMNDHFSLSGKIKTLDSLLINFSKDDSRVLIFSFSTQTMDLIENYLKSEGYKFLRMDGQTSNQKRTELADRFRKDDTYFVFLLSTKAMGLGLNLTEANKVIIFDVEWNPSWDAQAQDRAYRIGQTRDVQVIRLVSKGTIDELKYLRQLYKVQLKQETLEDVDAPDRKAAPHLFRGVQGDRDRKGELFGVENLLKFKDGSFLDAVWKQVGGRKAPRKSGDLSMHREMNVLKELSGEGCERLLVDGGDSVDMLDRAATAIMGRVAKNDNIPSPPIEHPDAEEEEENEFDIVANAVNHQDMFRDDRGRAAIEQGEDGFDEEMGGASQNVVAIYERGVAMPDDEPNLGVVDEQEDAGFDIVANAVNHQDLFRDDRGRAAIEQGEDGFDEEMGGGSQNVVAIYERGVEVAENPQDGSESPSGGGGLSIPNSPTREDSDGNRNDETSHQPFRAPVLPYLSREDETMRRVQRDRAVRKQAVTLNQNRPKPNRCHDDTHGDDDDGDDDDDPPEEVDRETVSDSSPVVAEDHPSPSVAKMPSVEARKAPIKYHLLGKLSGDMHHTTFSEADLPRPCYDSSKKKKKKSRKSKKKS